MQDAKDSFYEMLRGRLQTVNEGRTVSVRGLVRPGLLVDENEVRSACTLADCFHLHWAESALQRHGAMMLASLACEVTYATAGSPEFGGLDRGRALAAMDAELAFALSQSPQNCVKSSYAQLENGRGALLQSTRIWWGDPLMGEVESIGERLSRKVRVQVMSLLEGTGQ